MNTIEKKPKNDKHNGSIRLRSDGRWEARIEIEGSSKSLYGKSEAEVKKKLREYRNKKAIGYKDPKHIKLKDYIAIWLVEEKMGNIKASSYDRLESVFLHQIKPHKIGNKAIDAVTTKDIEDLLKERANPPSNSKIRPLAYSGLKKIVELLNPCFQYAFEHQHVNQNPVMKVKLPKKEFILLKTKEPFSLDDEQIKTFSTYAKVKEEAKYKYRYGLIFLFMLNTGLRVGEMIALEWKDVNWDKKYIKIDKTVEVVKNRKKKGNSRSTIITTPKTQNSCRFVHLNENALFYLEEIKKDNNLRKISSDYIACTKEGTLCSARNLQRTLDIITSKANLPHISLHILRHTFGSTLLRRGVEISVISKIMGHSNVNITYNKYIHVIKELEVEALNLLNIN